MAICNDNWLCPKGSALVTIINWQRLELAMILVLPGVLGRWGNARTYTLPSTIAPPPIDSEIKHLQQQVQQFKHGFMLFQ